ncbi:hypothetical protein [Vibrio splendidus]|uniref:hypothetical protein n=1 Tax=Vibrio splendidus TaxID=29497 RepID=UPI000C83C886|nr:hypothetical protein [Vibrio splendidus]PMI53605.1 hypothetical protein BCU42_20745 [Vibrio splendidus]
MNKISDKCEAGDCQLKPLRNGKCVLHCEKKDYSNDRHEPSFLSSFYDELRNYIINHIFSCGSRVDQMSLSKEKIADYLDNDNELGRLTKIQMNRDVVFDNIVFPARDSRDYFKLFKKIESAHFNYCSFSIPEIDINELKVFYQDCKFNSYWTVYHSELLENVNNTLYQCCTFYNDVSINSGNASDENINYSIFTDCHFSNKLEVFNSTIPSLMFNNSPNLTLNMKEVNLVNVIIEDKFVLNNVVLDSFNTENVSFKSKFEFKENTVREFTVFNTNFHKIFDAYRTKFDSYASKKCIFYDFSGFELCEFSLLEKQLAAFEYVTFLGFVNYRNAIFHGGLDLENTNLKEPPNFLKMKVNSENTNRETYRIIKNSFDKAGNHIEANKYFSLEMMKYKKELSTQPMSQEKLIFWLNKNISNFGMSYTRPIFLMFIFSIVYQGLIIGYHNNLLYKIDPEYNYYISSFSGFINNLASNIIPFNKFLFEGMEFMSLIFYVVFASLIWQTIVSIKKHTRSN